MSHLGILPKKGKQKVSSLLLFNLHSIMFTTHVVPFLSLFSILGVSLPLLHECTLHRSMTSLCNRVESTHSYNETRRISSKGRNDCDRHIFKMQRLLHPISSEPNREFNIMKKRVINLPHFILHTHSEFHPFPL